MNKSYNGNFTITYGRGPYHILASSTRRTAPLTKEKFQALLAWTIETDYCVHRFGAEECEYWGIKDFPSHLRNVVPKNIPPDQVNNYKVKVAKNKIFQKPFQFIFLSGIEFFKMFLWESTTIGFVTYPNWLTKLFIFDPFRYGIKLFLEFTSALSYFYLVFVLLTHRIKSHLSNENREKASILFFTFIILSAHMTLYATVLTVTRFALPIAPLFLISIAFSLNKLIAR